MRFLDYSSDGGCSKKASASELDEMLALVAGRANSSTLHKIHAHFPDCGEFILGIEKTFSSVDILFPMIDNPNLFGKIVVNHVLNDLYASLAIPKFALAILGIPRNLTLTSPEVIEMMSAASLALNEQSVPIVGGHSLAHQEDLFLGFTVVGASNEDRVPKSVPRIGDGIFMTKRIGTNIASLRWKLGTASIEDHQDVVNGMLQSNADVAKINFKLGVSFCTDISGFGLINNLTTLLKRANVGATLNISQIPIYASVTPYAANEEMLCSRQFYYNAEYAQRGHTSEYLNHPNSTAWLDAQTSGGLLFICPQASEAQLKIELEKNLFEITKIGAITNESAFHLEIAK